MVSTGNVYLQTQSGIFGVEQVLVEGQSRSIEQNTDTFTAGADLRITAHLRHDLCGHGGQLTVFNAMVNVDGSQVSEHTHAQTGVIPAGGHGIRERSEGLRIICFCSAVGGGVVWDLAVFPAAYVLIPPQAEAGVLLQLGGEIVRVLTFWEIGHCFCTSRDVYWQGGGLPCIALSCTLAFGRVLVCGSFLFLE